MPLIKQVIQPLVQHDIAGPALIQWAVIAALKLPQQLVAMRVDPAFNFNHTCIEVDFNFQVRIGNRLALP